MKLVRLGFALAFKGFKVSFFPVKLSSLLWRWSSRQRKRDGLSCCLVGAELHVCGSMEVVGLLIQGWRCLSGHGQPRWSLKQANSVLSSLLSPQVPQPRWGGLKHTLGLNKLFTFAVSLKVWLCSGIILTFSCFGAVGFLSVSSPAESL